jgi:regulator of protease activity HflC (stomatin/prohibitin superfamily)
MDTSLLIAIALVVIVTLFIRAILHKVIVLEYQRGLKYVRGRYRGVLPPGRYWIFSDTQIRPIDMRERVVTVPGQEVMSQDGISLKVSVTARYRVTDPAQAINEVEDYAAALYGDIQVQLRALVGSAPIEELLAQRPALGERLRAGVVESAQTRGLELLAADLKDIMFPGELKNVFMQVARARQEGLAALERARGETAALRNLANAASLIERNPALMQLRTLQAVAGNTGNTVVLTLDPRGVTPLPVPGTAGDAKT